MIIEYQYSVITRDNAADFAFSPMFWSNHPDWQFYVRTDQQWPDKEAVWVGGGGVTLDDAIESAQNSIRLARQELKEGDVVNPLELLLGEALEFKGSESPIPIKRG